MNENAHRTPSRARPQPVLLRTGIAIALCLLATSCELYDRTVFGGRPGTVEYPGSAAPPDAPAIYVVRQGDTVEGIASRFGVQPSLIAERNSLKPSDKLAEGQWLEIPNARVIEQAAGPPGAPPPPTGPSPAPTSTGGQVASADLPPPPGATPAQPPRPVAGTLPPPATKPDTRTASAPPESSPAPPPVPIPMPAGSPTTAAAPPASPPPAARPPSTSARFEWPVRGTTLQAFGSRPDGQRNDGINIAAAKGTSVKAAAGGTVAYVGNEVRGLGNLVLISHADGYVTAYAHLDKTSVDKGAAVKKGQTIGTVGQTGSVSQPQLHFEIRLRNKPVDPATLLP
jgi:murein DD-endopeptidase MepM/ murein hydrolase activator NlpD